MRTLQTTPARMVEEGGPINFGTYRRPFRNANLLDAPLYSFPVPRFWKNFRLKEWQHYGIMTPTHYFGVVIFDAKFSGASFLINIAGGMIRSDFHQPFGLYNGRLKDDHGLIYPIKDFFGLVEHHVTRY